MIAVTVSLDNIVQFLVTLEKQEKLSAFILYDKEFVLGHPSLLDTDFRPSANFEDNPLPTIDDVRDPAFRLLRGGGVRADQLLRNAPTVTDARVDDEFIVLKAVAALDNSVRKLSGTVGTLAISSPLIASAAVVSCAIFWFRSRANK